MRLHTLTVDDFFKDGEAVRRWAVAQKYGDVTGPDGVTYPNIHPNVPEGVLLETYLNVERLLGTPPDFKLSFVRLTPEGTTPPHWAHTDKAFTDCLLLVYLTAPRHCRGGTAFVSHISGMERNPETEEGVELWRRDTNDRDKWRLRDVVGMKFNRALICPTDTFHAALPKEGFGETAEDGRLVLTVFFNAKEK